LNTIIIKKLKNHYGKEAKIFILSLTKFLVLVSNSKSNVEKNLKRKVTIIYHDLPLPYEHIILDFSEYRSIQKIWEHMSLFAGYVTDGDITS
jgi:uncharacterized protein YcgL (UPF0745 family)